MNTNAFPLLFSDTLATDTSANWNFFAGSDDNVPDYTTNWAYNYGAIPYTFNGTTYVIPPAPNSASGSTTGVSFTVNDANGVDAAVNIYPKGQSFSGNFALKFDMWLNHPGGALGSGGFRHHRICYLRHRSPRHRNQLGRHEFPAFDGRHLVRRGWRWRLIE